MLASRVLFLRNLWKTIFDGKRCHACHEEVVLELPDENVTDQEASSDPEEDEKEEAVRDEDIEPGSKQHQRSQSLKKANPKV